MAEVGAHDVVNQSQSVGDLSPSDAPATTTIDTSNLEEENSTVAEAAFKENGIHDVSMVTTDVLEDISGRSDTDTSRAEGSIAGDKPLSNEAPKKFSVSKPVSFAKYSVPKVIAANAAIKGTDKAVPTPSSSTSSLQQVGRPRLVAKTTSSLQQKAKAYKPVAPDPSQVWNKNRVTPQPSTKHLTDEELQKQYGIHVISRIQADGDSKEAKWADIDDDEDDWAPETIEWNDGTKTTLAAADITPATAAALKQNLDIASNDPNIPAEAKTRPPQFISSIGPNATVLRLGQSAERQQAQRAAAEKARSPLERTPSQFSNAAPAPAPSKSPWASLPPVDKLSPISINPQPMAPPNRLPSNYGYAQSPANMTAPSPATEISADDFNRSWKDNSNQNQPRELFMPNSGRYEAVPEGRRRMSKNDQNFRAPAVLQRPSQSDVHAPAEPSAAFQTHRTSTDVSRRRASSTISGGSGQFARRMSIKSGEAPVPVFEDSQPRPVSQDGPSEPLHTPTYQARGFGADYVSTDPTSNQFDIEAQREKQRAEMKQRIELARKRKEEEQAAEDAAKAERIRQKLASLAPLPQTEKLKVEEQVVSAIDAEAAATQIETEHVRKPSEALSASAIAQAHSPPKPPQPQATGEPQQYGMMKVHPLDTVSKHGPAGSQPAGPLRPREHSDDALRMPPPPVVGARPSSDARRQLAPDSVTASDRSPNLAKPVTAGWGDNVDHRGPPLSNLWGTSSNKALGNGTFDQSLAGYAPQDLSRTSSTAQGWKNGRTPTSGRSPQPQHLNHLMPESRVQLPQSIVSPEATPLAADSEADTLFPVVRPAPIGPPPQYQAPSQVNGMTGGPQMNGTLSAWSSFHQVAGQQERAENDRYHRDLAARRAEEQRTGIRQGPSYTFNEMWKQVETGDQAGQRQLSNVVQTSVPPSTSFGAVGQAPRGSRFFPQHLGGHVQPDRRAVTYSHPEISRSPSPPPAEEYDSYHPAYDGDKTHPAVRLPREKPVVNLPSMLPPTPPSPIEPMVIAEPEPQTPLTWAARVSMPAPTPSLRAVSTPIAQTPSWQERFNGLFKPVSGKSDVQPSTPALAVTSSSKEPLDAILPTVSPSVSLPQHVEMDLLKDAGGVTSKDVETEEDLFEDRELASLPVVNPPVQSLVSLPLAERLRGWVKEVSSTTIDNYYMVSFPSGKAPFKSPEFALIRLYPGMKSIRHDLPQKIEGMPNRIGKPRNGSGQHFIKSNKPFRSQKSRQTSKAH